MRIGETSRISSAGLRHARRRSAAGRVDVPRDTVRSHRESCALFAGAQEQFDGRDSGLRATLFGSRIRTQVHGRAGIGRTQCQIESHRERDGVCSRSAPADREEERGTTGEYNIE